MKWLSDFDEMNLTWFVTNVLKLLLGLLKLLLEVLELLDLSHLSTIDPPKVVAFKDSLPSCCIATAWNHWQFPQTSHLVPEELVFRRGWSLSARANQSDAPGSLLPQTSTLWPRGAEGGSRVPVGRRGLLSRVNGHFTVASSFYSSSYFSLQASGATLACLLWDIRDWHPHDGAESLHDGPAARRHTTPLIRCLLEPKAHIVPLTSKIWLKLQQNHIVFWEQGHLLPATQCSFSWWSIAHRNFLIYNNVLKSHFCHIFNMIHYYYHFFYLFIAGVFFKWESIENHGKDTSRIWWDSAAGNTDLHCSSFYSFLPSNCLFSVL